jgi:hypothetical protein
LLSSGKVLHVTPYQLDEHQFAKTSEDTVAAGALLLAFHDGKTGELVEPAAARAR